MTELELADVVRDACLDALLRACEEAGVRGLCSEGRLEYAVDAVRRLDLSEVVAHRDDGAGADTSGIEP